MLNAQLLEFSKRARMSVCVMVIVVEVGRNAQIPEIFALLIYLCFWLCWVFGAACRLCLAAVHGLLLVVAFLVVEHRL